MNKNNCRLHADGLAYHTLGPFDLQLAAGECVALSGPSGAGKSLLLRALADLIPHRGEVRLDGVPSRHIPAPRWRCAVTLLPAESRWWAPTVGEHFPASPLSEHFEALGFGAEVMGWEAPRLSSGERQRLALLRVLALHPKVLLLDEPTANLDAANVRNSEALLRGYAEQSGAAMLWVSHDHAQIARVAARHMVLREGALQQIKLPA